MRHFLGSCVLLLAVSLTGCAEPPRFGQVAATLPPTPPGDARIFVYRPRGTFQDIEYTKVYFNGDYVGYSAPGGVFYRDVPPGQYLISVLSRELYPNQFKTVTVRPGDTVYAEIDSTKDWGETRSGPSFYTYVVVITAPPVALAEMQDLDFNREADRR